MSDIDGIALATVKAIGEIDSDKLPGGRPQAIARAQILVTDAIKAEIAPLQSENEALRARITEHAELLAKIEKLKTEAPPWLHAYTLERQAKALEAFAKSLHIDSVGLADCEKGYIAGCNAASGMLKTSARNLREAAEAEASGESA